MNAGNDFSFGLAQNKSLAGQPADLTWWNYLKWDVPTCTRTNEKNTVFWTVAC